ncbi:hypothetical protein DV515_00001770 [Chloebia gouldiae]|uniref:Uncharacterized protein n=1 Tax=Chloebia gouldiae TaxID=44316 RepID=A0A3L8T015_CHLGU|nr:hypothetical protein DV515_00001770 [Chloebia gouldiae]
MDSRVLRKYNLNNRRWVLGDHDIPLWLATGKASLELSYTQSEEIGNQGDSEAAPVLGRLFHWTAIGSELWSRHGTGRPKVPFQEVLQERKMGKFLASALLLRQKINRWSELTPWTMFSCCTSSEAREDLSQKSLLPHATSVIPCR